MNPKRQLQGFSPLSSKFELNLSYSITAASKKKKKTIYNRLDLRFIWTQWFFCINASTICPTQETSFTIYFTFALASLGYISVNQFFLRLINQLDRPSYYTILNQSGPQLKISINMISNFSVLRVNYLIVEFKLKSRNFCHSSVIYYKI